MKLNKSTIYIGLFSILYLIVAFSSFYHACAFFGLANNSWMSVILAFAFEIGQAAVLFSLLTSKKDRSRVMPWVLMTMFTLVQVIGNVFSSYKYIINNSVENLRYFKEPIFIWTNLPDNEATVIIVYIVGAILPVCALLLTSMITNYLSDQEELKNDSGISNDTKEKLTSMLNDALDNTSEKDWNEFIDNKEENAEESLKENKEIEDLKKELEIEKSLHQDISEEFPKVVEENAKKDEEIENLKKKIEELEQENKKENFKIISKPSNELIPIQPIETAKELKRYNTVDEALAHENENEGFEELKNITQYKDEEQSNNDNGKQPMETIEHQTDSKGEVAKTEEKENKDLKEVEDLIKNGINDNKKESHFVNI